MIELIQLVERASAKYRDKIRAIGSPLETFYRINSLVYYRIDRSDDSMILLANQVEIAQYYYTMNFQQLNPFLKHHSLLESGASLLSAVDDPRVHAAQARVDSKFSQHSHIALIDKDEDATHIHWFATTHQVKGMENVYLNNIDRLRLYCRYFRAETASMQKSLQEIKIDCKQAVGAYYFEKLPNQNSSKESRSRVDFFLWMNKNHGGLRLHSPLSQRELECLTLILEGKSASCIAERLQIKTRTVEHYIESIKTKLGCSSKQELFEYVTVLKECGGELNMLQLDSF